MKSAHNRFVVKGLGLSIPSSINDRVNELLDLGVLWIREGKIDRTIFVLMSNSRRLAHLSFLTICRLNSGVATFRLDDAVWYDLMVGVSPLTATTFGGGLLTPPQAWPMVFPFCGRPAVSGVARSGDRATTRGRPQRRSSFNGETRLRSEVLRFTHVSSGRETMTHRSDRCGFPLIELRRETSERRVRDRVDPIPGFGESSGRLARWGGACRRPHSRVTDSVRPDSRSSSIRGVAAGSIRRRSAMGQRHER